MASLADKFYIFSFVPLPCPAHVHHPFDGHDEWSITGYVINDGNFGAWYGESRLKHRQYLKSTTISYYKYQHRDCKTLLQ